MPPEPDETPGGAEQPAATEKPAKQASPPTPGDEAPPDTAKGPEQGSDAGSLQASPAAREVAHLLRRTGFGPDPTTWATWKDRPYEEVVEAVLASLDTELPAEPEGFDPYVPGSIQQLWLERMVNTPLGLAERLAFFWHGHFATSEAKIQDPVPMWNQYKLFRSKGAGRFEDLVLGVSRDVAMIRWLDGNANRKGHANENYGRELQELFTLGIGNYTEQDIREVARAFTGWGSRHHTFVFREQFHDKDEKTIHGVTGNFTGEDVVRLLCRLDACHRFIAHKLITHFSHPDPSPDEIESMAASFKKHDGHIKSVLRDLFLSEGFRGERARLRLVRSPIEFVVGALRTAGLDSVPAWAHGGLDRMGQILFRPPSVKGWTEGTGWLSSGAVVERLRVAQQVAAMASTEAGDRALGFAFPDGVPAALRQALGRAEGKQRLTVVLGCPEFQLA